MNLLGRDTHDTLLPDGCRLWYVVFKLHEWQSNSLNNQFYGQIWPLTYICDSDFEVGKWLLNATRRLKMVYTRAKLFLN